MFAAKPATSSNPSAFWQEVGGAGLFERISVMDHAQTVATTEAFGTHNYHPLPVTVARGEGPYVWDPTGKRYIDCVGSYSALAHGHLAPEVVEVARRQLSILTLTSRAVYTREMALLLEALCLYTQTDMACPMNTGAEAIETAIKLARKWAYTVKGVPEEKAEIVAAENNFHGRTTTIIGFSSEEAYRAHFGPFTPGFKVIPFGDIGALRAAVTPNAAAVLIEPIQAEAGILLPPDGFLAAARKLCTENRVLLIWDEIQTGFCRTGKRFAWQHEDAEPDMMCLGKGLGGGVMPVSAVVGKKEVMGVFVPGDHGSTFGGNPLASVVAVIAMAEMVNQRLDEASAAMGRRLIEGFAALRSPAIAEMRGRGLLVGLEVSGSVDCEALGAAFLDEGILTKETRRRTFRFAPPLTSEASVIDEIVHGVGRALASVA